MVLSRVVSIQLFCLACALAVLVEHSYAREPLINSDMRSKIQKIYGHKAVERIDALDRLLVSLSTKSDSQKLKEVNKFYNSLRFVSDDNHWAQEDYWATPVELIATNGGDCEDFAIAKYLTLKSLGMADQQLRLTYVKALKINQAHMVLTYYPKPGEEPLVLDNLIDSIESASKRSDLEPVYSFNGQGLWLAKKRGEVVRLGDGDDVTMWRDLQQRVVSHQMAIPGRGGT